MGEPENDPHQTSIRRHVEHAEKLLPHAIEFRLVVSGEHFRKILAAPKIRSAAERLIARAGEQTASDTVVFPHPLKGLVQFPEHQAVHRIALFGPIQHQFDNTIRLLLVQYRLVTHFSSRACSGLIDGEARTMNGSTRLKLAALRMKTPFPVL